MYTHKFRNLTKLFRNSFALKNVSKYQLALKLLVTAGCTSNVRRKASLFRRQNCIYYGLGFLCLTFFYENLKRNFIVPSVEAKDEGIFRVSHRTRFNFVADVVEKTAPSVVFIGVVDNWRKDFFTGQPLLKSNGSGFIVRSDGLILTNAHVVSQKRRLANLIVKLSDGSVYPATVEYVDVKHDLATIKINPGRSLVAMRLGSAHDLRPGEWVIAIGSPLSFSNTATCGVVSTVERTALELGIRGSRMYYIQTDAPITFGNSGGPLVNLNGEVIGINSMKVTTGISFAIPIEYAKEFLKLTTRTASTDYPEIETEPKKYTGITVLSLNTDIIRELQLRDKRIPNDVTFGVLIWKVVEDSPACLGGLKPGDILTHINGIAVQSADTLYEIIEKPHCCTLTMVVVRGDKRLTFSVVPEVNEL